MEYIKDEANKRDTDTVIHEKSVAETLNSTNAELRIRIIEQKDTFMSGASFWERKYSTQIKRKFTIANKCTKEVKLRVLHFKLIHNIYPTNIVLNRMKIKATEKCETCGVTDHIEHFFIKCELLNGFWKSVENTIRKYTNINHITLTEENILLGIDATEKMTTNQYLGCINHIILIAKLSISKFKCSKNETRFGLDLIFESKIRLRERYLN